MTTVTAIITTHNRAGMLPHAVASVLAQKRKADEIIIVDDGSNDSTSAHFAGLPTQCSILRQTHSGISAARNMAIQHAKSEWLAFLDDDDEWLPDKLQTQLTTLEKNPGFRLCHSEEIWIRKGRRVNAMNKHRKYGGWIYPYCLPRCIISPSAAMIHRSLFNSTGLFDTSLPACEDYDLWLRICAYNPVLFIDTPLITKHGGHSDQLSRKYWGMDRFRITALEKMIEDINLNPKYLKITLNMLIKKTDIYLKGALKRNRHQEVRQFKSKLREYRMRLTQQQADI